MTTAIFIFLLDNIPGFEIAFNSSLQSINDNFTIDYCDSQLSEVLWNEILNIEDFNSLFKDLNRSQKDIGNMHKLKSEINTKQTQFNYPKSISAINNSKSHKYLSTHAPFLVAIFETLSNITAQTCGGVLLNRNWVLTASTCINVLPYIYRNGSDIGRNYHTVIANTTNPLSDGSVHNVTDVVFHPKKRVPLALMRLSPSVVVEPLKLYNSNILYNLDTMVYGWSVYKTDNGSDVMRINAVESKAHKCDASHAFKESYSLICLIDKKSSVAVNQMSPGGPVMVLRHKKQFLVGIVLVDSISFLVPINHYYGWIDYTIRK